MPPRRKMLAAPLGILTATTDARGKDRRVIADGAIDAEGFDSRLRGISLDMAITILRDSMATRARGREHPYGEGYWTAFNQRTNSVVLASLDAIDAERSWLEMKRRGVTAAEEELEPATIARSDHEDGTQQALGAHTERRGTSLMPADMYGRMRRPPLRMRERPDVPCSWRSQGPAMKRGATMDMPRARQLRVARTRSAGSTTREHPVR